MSRLLNPLRRDAHTDDSRREARADSVRALARAPHGAAVRPLAPIVDIGARARAGSPQAGWAALVAHDLRTPLTVVAGHAQILRDHFADSPEAQSSVAAIVASCRRMNAMIGELLESAQLESGAGRLAHAPLDLGELVARVVAEQLPPDERRVRFLRPEADIPVTGDGARLGRVVLNLLTNALKYSPPGCPVEVAVTRQGDAAVLDVSDHGRGIAPSDLTRIFQPFYRALGAETREGLGLGLFIARLIVEAHGGGIAVDSTPGLGSTFTVALPLSEAD
ncbi:MAG TPA: HAMP domain-containing sensor histidine kinase [Polyangia bacterium]|jgi:signal transduction histidine kinase